MSNAERHDWNPGAYDRFRGFRLKPAQDLLSRVPADLPDGPVVDLGCGAGAAARLLGQRWPDRVLVGVDRSPAMLAEARAAGHYDVLLEAHIGEWRADEVPALIFSNAALQWVPGHGSLLPHLAGFMPPGGVLAVQMPDQQSAPSHRLLREVSARLHPDLFDWREWTPEVMAPAAILDLLAPLGQVMLWQTVYHQLLPACEDAHPVRRFTETTAARPVLNRLSGTERDGFLRAYDAALAQAYPRRPNGAVLFPFTRLFFVLVRGG